MVSYVGLTELELPELEVRHTHLIADRHLERLRALTEDIVDARLRVKRVRKSGDGARYEVTVAVLTNDGPRYAASSSWTLATAIHNAFESVENQLAARRESPRHDGGHRAVWTYPNLVS